MWDVQTGEGRHEIAWDCGGMREQKLNVIYLAVATQMLFIRSLQLKFDFMRKNGFVRQGSICAPLPRCFLERVERDSWPRAISTCHGKR